MKNFTSKNQKTGKLGEDIACLYLERKGFSIEERNYTKKWGEIDIIAKKDNKIYFVEVKSVSTNFTCNNNEDMDSRVKETFRPEENLHYSKLKRLSRTIETYLIHKRVGNTPWQFDALIVFLCPLEKKARVRRIENIVL
jgi:putative endonuclease